MREGFVAEFNAMTKDYYSDNFFISILGESVDEQWVKYKTASVVPPLAPAPAC